MMVAAETHASYGHVPDRLQPPLLTAKAYHYRATDKGTLYLHRNTDAGSRARAGALSAGAAGLALAGQSEAGRPARRGAIDLRGPLRDFAGPLRKVQMSHIRDACSGLRNHYRN